MFLYYLPDRLTISLEELRAVGLGYAFDARGWTFGKAPKGPDGKEGMLVGYCGGNERLLAYKPDEQTWRGVPGTPAMVGMYTADPPSPKSLLRPSALPGRSLELGDGREWLVPVVRTWRGDEESAAWVLELPVAVEVDDAGNWNAAQVVAQYAQLYHRAQAYFRLRMDALTRAFQRAREEDVEDEDTVRESFVFADIYDVALDLLAANYRIGKAEVSLLRLFTSQLAVQMLDVAVDWPTLEAWLEKKTPSPSSPTSAGDEGLPQAIVPQSPS